MIERCSWAARKGTISAVNVDDTETEEDDVENDDEELAEAA